jgi:hypothetical protein
VEALEARCLSSFSPAVSYPVGEYATALVTADFNNDSRLDLATATGGVLLGNGDGSFQPAIRSAAGAGPLSVAVGDFDGDGNRDLVTANAYDVTVLMGNGDGTFQAPAYIDFPYGEYPQSVAVGDFNGDGLLDLGVTSNTHYDYYSDPGPHSYASVLLGRGDGTFAGRNVTPLDYRNQVAAVAADINGDAFDDLVTITSGWSSGGAVLLGHSSGYLQSHSGFSAGDLAVSVAAGDLDADGDTDLVTGNEYGNTVRVLLGDGSGNFSAGRNYAAGGYPAALVLGDFTGDGKVDVATTYSVLRGGGDGTLAPWLTFATNSAPSGVAAGDFNGDGWLDAATAGAAVSVLINDRSWPSPAPPTVRIDDRVTVPEPETGSILLAFNVTLSYASAVDVTVHYATADITATAGSDYTAASGDLVIPAGQTTRPFGVLIKADRLAEPTESFAVNLSAPRNATLGRAQAICNILDTAPRPPRISISDVSRKEGKRNQTTQFTFTVTLSVPSDQPVTVSFRTVNGTATTGDGDYVARSGTLTFAPGQTTKTITIEVKGDSKRESDEYFYLDLFDNSSNSLVLDGRGVGTILNDD